MSLRSRTVVYAAAVMLVGNLALVALQISPGGAEQQRSGPSENRETVGAHVEVLQTVEAPVGEAIWQLSRSVTQETSCLEVIGELVAGSQSGTLTSCGKAEDGSFRSPIGGIELGGQWFNVSFGQAPTDASRVLISLRDGSTRNVPVLEGGWILVMAASPFNAGREVAKIQALDAAGQVVASFSPPSMVAIDEERLDEPNERH